MLTETETTQKEKKEYQRGRRKNAKRNYLRNENGKR
jgi:hypothetical protein